VEVCFDAPVAAIAGGQSLGQQRSCPGRLSAPPSRACGDGQSPSGLPISNDTTCEEETGIDHTG
jgi:hypothetical protein